MDFMTAIRCLRDGTAQVISMRDEPEVNMFIDDGCVMFNRKLAPTHFTKEWEVADAVSGEVTSAMAAIKGLRDGTYRAARPKSWNRQEYNMQYITLTDEGYLTMCRVYRNGQVEVIGEVIELAVGEFFFDWVAVK